MKFWLKSQLELILNASSNGISLGYRSVGTIPRKVASAGYQQWIDSYHNSNGHSLTWNDGRRFSSAFAMRFRLIESHQSGEQFDYWIVESSAVITTEGSLCLSIDRHRSAARINVKWSLSMSNNHCHRLPNHQVSMNDFTNFFFSFFLFLRWQNNYPRINRNQFFLDYWFLLMTMDLLIRSGGRRRARKRL